MNALYYFAPMGPTLCTRLDDSSGSLQWPCMPIFGLGDHFRPSQAPAPTGAAAVSSVCLAAGRPAAAAAMLSGLAVLSR